MSTGFYRPDEIGSKFDQIIPAYREAFAGEPWFEVSKCASPEKLCPGGDFSAIQIGELCGNCGLRPSFPAYDATELIERFDRIGATRPTSWYIEENESGVNLAALAWVATAPVVSAEKYVNRPEMTDWLDAKFGESPFIWVDEVFANKKIQSRGNLRNFGSMCLGFVELLGPTTLAYRTITPQMLAAPQSSFPQESYIDQTVPDKRSFVVIDLKGTRR